MEKNRHMLRRRSKILKERNMEATSPLMLGCFGFNRRGSTRYITTVAKEYSSIEFSASLQNVVAQFTCLKSDF
ncbi:hypothetical protein OUZ56_032158 [Daphnia magna]|uniref:Uncharacterized protein n=1 Tax=Daphnia magna TaxID=35525 RepID=A0ABQ9ZWC3_9CRUS|nr:hypothetical protein OUZ56_032158 [Daphnia magna]